MLYKYIQDMIRYIPYLEDNNFDSVDVSAQNNNNNVFG